MPKKAWVRIRLWGGFVREEPVVRRGQKWGKGNSRGCREKFGNRKGFQPKLDKTEKKRGVAKRGGKGGQPLGGTLTVHAFRGGRD